MQAVADFYAGFALFMLFGSVIGLVAVALQPVFDRFQSAHSSPIDRSPSPDAGTDEPRARSQHDRLRRAA